MQTCKPSGKRIEIRNVSYDTCTNCGKPISGSGQSLGATACFILKDFVRSGKIVPFSDNWRRLAESCGFETIEWVHASLVEDHGTQHGLFGEDKRLRKSRKSFFRRLAEAKGSPPIDHEDVLFMRRKECQQ